MTEQYQRKDRQKKRLCKGYGGQGTVYDTSLPRPQANLPTPLQKVERGTIFHWYQTVGHSNTGEIQANDPTGPYNHDRL